MKNNYIVVYTGKLQQNASFVDVVQQVSTFFKVPKEKAEALVTSNRPTVIKKGLSYDVAIKYQKALSRTGMEIKIGQIAEKKELNDNPIYLAQNQNNKKRSEKELFDNLANASNSQKTASQNCKSKRKGVRTGGISLLLIAIIACGLGYYFISLDKEYRIGPFEANYYFENDGRDAGKGTDGNDPNITPELQFSETVKRPSISFGYTKLYEIDPYNFYGTWEGEIVIPNEDYSVNVNFDVSWSDVSFYVDGKLKAEWKNENKIITLKLPKGTHKIKVEQHNHWHTAGFNVSFTNYRKISKSSAVEKLQNIDLQTIKTVYAGAYEASSRTPGNFYNEILITLPDTSSPLFLFLNSHNAVNWVISNPNNIEIKGVVLSSYAPGSTIANNGNSPVYELPYFRNNYKSPYGIKSLIGKDVDYVFSEYSISEITY